MIKEKINHNKTEIMAEFLIVGDELDLKYVTEKLSILPTRTQIKGDFINNKKIKAKDTCWEFSTGYSESIDISEQLSKIFSVFVSKKRELLEIREKYHIEYKINFVVNIVNEYAPCIHFNKEYINFFDTIGAEIDIDLYIL